jgi:hypothetical protein
MRRLSLSDSIRLPSARRQMTGGIAHALVVSLAVLSVRHPASGAGVLPQGGRYVAGAGTIVAQGGSLTVTQPDSARGVIDWSRIQAVGADLLHPIPDSSRSRTRRVPSRSRPITAAATVRRASSEPRQVWSYATPEPSSNRSRRANSSTIMVPQAVRLRLD